MNTRRLSLAGAVVTVAALLGACTATPAPPDPGSDALAYVELLRGENDLAHGSLEVPATSSLPDASAAIAAIRHSGRAAPQLADDTLARLVQRAGDEPAWVAVQLCEATGDDRAAVERILGAEVIASILAIAPGSIDSANDVADRITLETARSCLGVDGDDDLDAATRTALERYAAGNALVGARLLGLYGERGYATPRELVQSSDASRVAAALADEGCTEWVFAHSVATLRLGAVSDGATDDASRSIRDCATSTTVPLTEPASLSYAIAAGLDPEQTALLLDHNADALETWLVVEPRIAEPGDAPIGLGTVSSTRDALALLRLRGVVTEPRWMGEGVVAASGGDIEPADRIDLLHLCVALEVSCDATFVHEATELLTTETASVVDAVLAGGIDDFTAARLLETATSLGPLPAEYCSRNEASALYARAPQVLAVLATVEKACVELLRLTDDGLATAVEDALDDLRPDDALALCLLRSLANGADRQPSTFTLRSRAALERLWIQFDTQNGDGFLHSARPLRVELLTAKADQWLE